MAFNETATERAGRRVVPGIEDMIRMKKSVPVRKDEDEDGRDFLDKSDEVHRELYDMLDEMLRQCDKVRRFMDNNYTYLSIGTNKAPHGIKGYTPYFEFERYIDGEIREVCNEINTACMNISTMRRSQVAKSPVMDTMFGAEESIEMWNSRCPSLPAESVDDAAPNASVVFGIANLDVIWYLDDETSAKLLTEMGVDPSGISGEGYHPGLFVSPHGDDEFMVVATCYLETDPVFSKYGDDRMMSAEEVKGIIREVESAYSGHFLTPRGIPVDYRH